jgi:hypothetical protein
MYHHVFKTHFRKMKFLAFLLLALTVMAFYYESKAAEHFASSEARGGWTDQTGKQVEWWWCKYMVGLGKVRLD